MGNDPTFVIRLEGEGDRSGGTSAAGQGEAEGGAASAGQAAANTGAAASSLAGEFREVMRSAGASLGAVVGHARAGAALAQTVHDRFNKVATIPTTPVVGPATMGDVMGLPRGIAYTVRDFRGADDTPIVKPASMGEVMGASAKGGIAVGRFVSAPLAASGAAGGAGPAVVSGAAGASGGGSSVAGLGAAAGGMAGLVATAVQMHVANQRAGWGRIANSGNDFTGILAGHAQNAFGPIGGPIASRIVDVVSSRLGNIVRAPGEIAQHLGSVTSAVAQNQNYSAIAQTGQAFNELAEKTPLVGHQLAMVGESAGKVVGAFRDATNSFVERGRQISHLNPQLALSYAKTDVRELLADIREANTLGGPLSRLNEARTDIDQTLRQFLLPIKAVIVDGLASLLELLNGFAKQGITRIDDLQQNAVHKINELIGQINRAINTIISCLPGGEKLPLVRISQLAEGSIVGAMKKVNAAAVDLEAFARAPEDLGPGNPRARRPVGAFGELAAPPRVPILKR